MNNPPPYSKTRHAAEVLRLIDVFLKEPGIKTPEIRKNHNFHTSLLSSALLSARRRALMKTDPENLYLCPIHNFKIRVCRFQRCPKYETCKTQFPKKL